MEKEKENVEVVSHDQEEEEEEVTPKTTTTKKKKKKIMSEEHEISEQKNNHEQEEGVTNNTKTPAKKKKKKMMSEEHEISEQEEGVTKNTKKKKKSEEHGSSEQNKNHEQEEGVTKNMKKTPTKKKKKSEEHESSDLNSHSLVLALPATPKNVAVKKKKNKIGNVVENVEEGSVSEKKKRTKNKNKGSENVEEDRKIELDEDLVKSETDSKMAESCKEMGLEGKKISSKKKKKRDENEMEVAADGNDETGSEHTKIERRKKKKRCISSVIVDMEEKALEEAMRELMVKVKKPASVVQTEENDMEVDTEMKKRKKKKKHGSSECTKIMDTKPLEDILQDLSVEEKPEAVQQAVENHEEVNMELEVMKKQLSSSENGDPGIALLTSENHEQISASKKKKTSRKKKLIAQNMLKEGSQELQLPVESGLKGSLLADENHVSRIKDKSTVCNVKASNDASAHDLSIKQPVEKSGVSSSELLKEVKTTQLDLPKNAPVGALCPHVGTRRKLLILDLNGLLLDIVMVVPRGYKAEKRIGQKSVFKRPFCDDFLKFCFERFEVGVWTSRTKRNMDDVIGFLMPNTKHKLLFCWDQSHCTMTGINTIDNRHKPLVCKELSKLWDKHEPSLPWEKGEYNESNTLLLDDSPYKALLNPPNTAIFPSSYSLVDKNDNSLGPEGDIRLYLEGVAAAEDVQKYVKQHPFGQPAITDTSSSWGFYCRVFDQFKRQLD